MIHAHHAMLSPVLDILKSTEAYIPLGNHTSFERMMESEANAVLQTTASATELNEKEKKYANHFLHLALDAVSAFKRVAVNPSWVHLSLEERLAKVQRIQTSPQIPQRSEEWYRNYSKVLTASEFSALFTNTKRRKDLVYSKANPPQEQTSNFRLACPTQEMNAIGWGIRFEPVVKQILESKEKCKIYEPGRLQHPTNIQLAASPDGLIASAHHTEMVGRLVEIKCPYSRTIGGEIPLDYWIQMQIQMEVADVDECEYIEANLISKRANQEEPLDLSGTTYQGNLYLLKQIVSEGMPYEYRYIYGDIGSSSMPPIPEGFLCVETIPWGLKSWHRKLVSRDKSWYEATKTWQESFWNDVEKVRQGEEFQVQTPKLKSGTPCLIVDD